MSTKVPRRGRDASMALRKAKNLNLESESLAPFEMYSGFKVNPAEDEKHEDTSNGRKVDLARVAQANSLVIENGKTKERNEVVNMVLS